LNTPQNTPSNRFTPTRGERITELIENAKTYIDQGDIANARQELEVFIQGMPENGEASDALRHRLDQLHKDRKQLKTHISDNIAQRGYLEQFDAINYSQRLELIFTRSMYYACKAIYHKFRLYEDNSLLDYTT